MERTAKFITASIIMVLLGGTAYYLTPDTSLEYDVCRSGDYGEWVNVTPTLDVNDDMPALGRYRCEIENKTRWCGRTTTTRCYYLLEEFVPASAVLSVEEYKLLNITDYGELQIRDLENITARRELKRFNCTELQRLITNYEEDIPREEDNRSLSRLKEKYIGAVYELEIKKENGECA